MLIGTEQNPNPKSSSITQFLQSLERPVTAGYVGLRNGQIIRRDTMERWQVGAPSRKQAMEANKAKYIKAPAATDRRNRIPGSKKRKLKANREPL